MYPLGPIRLRCRGRGEADLHAATADRDGSAHSAGGGELFVPTAGELTAPSAASVEYSTAGELTAPSAASVVLQVSGLLQVQPVQTVQTVL
jgi:hypothetical protein